MLYAYVHAYAYVLLGSLIYGLGMVEGFRV